MIKKKNSYVTFVDVDTIKGVVALSNSLKKVESKWELLVMYNNLEPYDIKYLKGIGIKLVKVKPEFRLINIWNLNIEKVIYIESDCVVLKNIDHLFDIDAHFAACQNNGVTIGNQEFNIGVMLIKPSKKVFNDLSKMAKDEEHKILNEYFPYGDNIVLDNNYNVLKRILRHHRKIWDGLDIHVLRFVGNKPWQDKNNDDKQDN